MAEDIRIISHWYHLLDGVQYSPKDFYESLEKSIGKREIPTASLGRVSYPESGLLSAHREYLRIQRQGFGFDICAAHFGNGFFVSWWQFTQSGCLAIITEIPILGLLFRWLVRPITYWQLDTGLMFQSAVHASVLEVLDAMTTEKGARAISELERKPIMKEFFKR